jgi:hypothetical protein
MFLAVAFVIMTTVVSDGSVSQNLAIPKDEMELLEQLEFLEAWDILKSPAIDQEMKQLLPEGMEGQGK